MKIVIQSSAIADLRAGYRFYERKEQGLGGYFLDSLYSDIDSLHRYAGIHSCHFGRFHRLLSKRFPFAVYYEVKADVIWVRAVLDLRRDPAKLRNKLRNIE